MSERELQRIEVLSKVVQRRMSVIAAAHVLALSVRQVQRLLKTFRRDGASALRHKARGRRSNHQIADGLRDYALTLVQERYGDFGPTLAAEMLADQHGVVVSRELIQIDGSEHRWFENRGDDCTLLVFIDDATSALMLLRFAKSESTFSYFEALKLYLTLHGCPTAFYSDKYSVFRVAKAEARAGRGMTQFGRALCDLNIEILCANSSQAKGRVERANRTLQDRLVKQMRLAGVSDIDSGNAFLPGFMARFNDKFAKTPARSEDLHRPLTMKIDRLRDVLCKREQRYVGQQLSFSDERKQIMLEKNDISDGLTGKYVDTYDFTDGRFEVRWKGCSLPNAVFDKDQRVTHTAIVENKRLGPVLAYIAERQKELGVKRSGRAPRREGQIKSIFKAS